MIGRPPQALRGEVVWVVRHGETALSSRGAYSGRREVPLTASGLKQAREAARRLRSEGVDLIVTSPLGRARDTAALIADATGAPSRVDERLSEVDYGPLEGTDRAQATERFGAAYLRWREQPFAAGLDGMEPLSAALSRARAATTAALADAARPVLVGHQGILRLVLVGLGALRREDYFDVAIPEAAPFPVPVDATGRVRAGHVVELPARGRQVRG